MNADQSPLSIQKSSSTKQKRSISQKSRTVPTSASTKTNRKSQLLSSTSSPMSSPSRLKSPSPSPSPSRSKLRDRGRHGKILNRFRLRSHSNQMSQLNSSINIENEFEMDDQQNDHDHSSSSKNEANNSGTSSKTFQSTSTSATTSTSSSSPKKGKGFKRFIHRKKNNRRLQSETGGHVDTNNETSNRRQLDSSRKATDVNMELETQSFKLTQPSSPPSSRPINRRDKNQRVVLRDINHYPMETNSSNSNSNSNSPITSRSSPTTLATSTMYDNSHNLIQKKKRKSLENATAATTTTTNRFIKEHDNEDGNADIQTESKYDPSSYRHYNNNSDDEDCGNRSDDAVHSDSEMEDGSDIIDNGTGSRHHVTTNTSMEEEENGNLLKRFRDTTYSRKYNISDDNNTIAPPPFTSIEINISPKKDNSMDISDDSSLSPKYSPSSSDIVRNDSFYCDDNGADFNDFNSFGSAGNHHDKEEEDDEEDDDESESSCASTVANDKPPRLVRPPPSATQEEQATFYWELCYGKETKKMEVPAKSWSARRKPPVKSCLSTKKIPWTEIAQSASKRSARRNHNHSILQNSTPTACDHFHFQQDGKIAHNPSPLEKDGASITFNGHDTPIVKTPQSNDDSGMKNVKFGDASAAEFESSHPTVELTPLPSEKVRERFPVEEKIVESDDESVELHHETARNGARLALWDDDFDDYINEDIDMDDDYLDDNGCVAEIKIPGKKHGKRLSTSSRRSDRRSSIFFSRDGGSLVEEKSKKGTSHLSTGFPIGKRNNQVDDAVGLVDDDNDFSPMTRNSMHSLSSRASESFRLSTSDSENSMRNSLQFSSPSTSTSYRLSTSDSETSKVTPKADLNSSSLLLRSVHSAGGASMERNHNIGHDDMTQDLKPSQLDNTLRELEEHKNVKENYVSRNTSMIDKIISSEISTSDSSTLSTHHFGSLLKERSNYFSSSYDITVSAFLNNMLNKMEVHSHVNISEAICEMLLSKAPDEANIGKHDVVEVLNMSVSFLEQELLTMKDSDTKETKSIGGFVYQNFDPIERTELYSILVEAAFSNWERLESEALETVSSCLRLIHQSNCEEDAKLVNVIANNNKSNQYRLKRKIKPDKHALILAEIEAIEDLENKIYKEEQELKHLSHLSSLWASKVEVEMNSPVVAIDYILLNQIITFNEKLLMLDKVEISYPHLDGHSSETIISWTSNHQYESNRRHSLCSMDSSHSSDGVMGLLTTSPTINRIKKAKISCDDPIPRGCAAYKLYTAILNSDYVCNFIPRCFKQEQETGILIVTDIFQRLNLLAMDVMELQKYYSCRVERPQKSTSIILHVTISLGVTFSIGIRFTYDLSSSRTILYSIPSDTFILPITGEPAVPINMLIRIAKQTIFNEPISNAFILKRTCSAIVKTLQGRDFE